MPNCCQIWVFLLPCHRHGPKSTVLDPFTLNDSILPLLKSSFLLAFVKFMFFSIIFPKIAAFSAGPKKNAFFMVNLDEICTAVSGQDEFSDGGHVDTSGRSVTSGTSHACLGPRSLVSYGCPHFQPSSAPKLLNNTVFLPHFVAISKAVNTPGVFWDGESGCSYGNVDGLSRIRQCKYSLSSTDSPVVQ
jgi:hypothetical protein